MNLSDQGQYLYKYIPTNAPKMDSLFWSSTDISRFPSLTYKTSSVVVGTSHGKSDIMRTNDTNALYINADQQLLINTICGAGRVNIGDIKNHIICYYASDHTKYSTLEVDQSGSLHLSSTGSIYLDGSVYLGGTQLQVSATELNYNYDISPGTASAGKSIVLDGTRSIAGINNLLAVNVHGVLRSPSQPYITSIGTLSTLKVTNNITTDTISGTLQTGEQPNITLVGTLSSLNVINGIISRAITGTLQTGNQPNITTVGTLTSLNVMNEVTASALFGTMQTEHQPNITRVGTLETLNVSNAITADTLSGVIQTASQPNITSVGILSSLVVSNGINTTSVTASLLIGTIYTPAQPNITSIGTLQTLSVANGITSSTYTGIIQTSAQTKITSVGTLISLDVSGRIVSSSDDDAAIVTSGGIFSAKKIVAGDTIVSMNPIDTSSGGTGIDSYSKGDILVGDDNHALTKVAVAESFGSLLSSDTSSRTGVSWGYGFITQNYSILEKVQTISSTMYSIGPYHGRDTTNQYNIYVPLITVDVRDSCDVSASTVYYCYAAIDSNGNGKYVFSSYDSDPPVTDGYDTYAKLPFYVVSDRNASLVASRYVGDVSSRNTFIQLMKPISMIDSATNIDPMNTQLCSFVPTGTTSIVLLITHKHETTGSCGVSIGHNSSGLETTVLTTATPSTIQIQYTLPVNEMNIDTYLTSEYGKYSIDLCGFYV